MASVNFDPANAVESYIAQEAANSSKLSYYGGKLVSAAGPVVPYLPFIGRVFTGLSFMAGGILLAKKQIALVKEEWHRTSDDYSRVEVAKHVGYAALGVFSAGVGVWVLVSPFMGSQSNGTNSTATNTSTSNSTTCNDEIVRPPCLNVTEHNFNNSASIPVHTEVKVESVADILKETQPQAISTTFFDNRTMSALSDGPRVSLPHDEAVCNLTTPVWAEKVVIPQNYVPEAIVEEDGAIAGHIETSAPQIETPIEQPIQQAIQEQKLQQEVQQDVQQEAPTPQQTAEKTEGFFSKFKFW